MTQEELAKTMGKSQSAVSNKLRLLSLCDEVQQALLKEEISERHARALLSVEDIEEQKKLLKEIIENKMTVRQLEAKIKGEDQQNNEQNDDVENDEKEKLEWEIVPHLSLSKQEITTLTIIITISIASLVYQQLNNTIKNQTNLTKVLL